MKFYLGVLYCCLQIWCFCGYFTSGASIQLPVDQGHHQDLQLDHYSSHHDSSPMESEDNKEHKITIQNDNTSDKKPNNLRSTLNFTVAPIAPPLSYDTPRKPAKSGDSFLNKMKSQETLDGSLREALLPHSISNQQILQSEKHSAADTYALSDFQDSVAKVINPHPYKYIMNQPGACFGQTVKLLIIVCSAIEHFEQREVIRATWGGHVEHTTRVFFLLGAPGPHTNQEVLQYQVSREASRYQDIIQEDFIDSYRNLSLKSVAMLKWASLHCSNAKYLLKTDDDMYINVPVLIQDLDTTVHKRFIMGDIIAGAEPVQDIKSKWYTPKSRFSAKMYPRYLSGTAYVISGDLIYNLYQSTLYTKLFWLEDIYITGLCAQRVKAQHIYNGKFGYKKRHLDPCLFRVVVTGHRVSPEELYVMWLAVHSPRLKCRHIRINMGNAE